MRIGKRRRRDYSSTLSPAPSDDDGMDVEHVKEEEEEEDNENEERESKRRRQMGSVQETTETEIVTGAAEEKEDSGRGDSSSSSVVEADGDGTTAAAVASVSNAVEIRNDGRWDVQKPIVSTNNAPISISTAAAAATTTTTATTTGTTGTLPTILSERYIPTPSHHHPTTDDPGGVRPSFASSNPPPPPPPPLPVPITRRREFTTPKPPPPPPPAPPPPPTTRPSLEPVNSDGHSSGLPAEDATSTTAAVSGSNDGNGIGTVPLQGRLEPCTIPPQPSPSSSVVRSSPSPPPLTTNTTTHPISEHQSQMTINMKQGTTRRRRWWWWWWLQIIQSKAEIIIPHHISKKYILILMAIIICCITPRQLGELSPPIIRKFPHILPPPQPQPYRSYVQSFLLAEMNGGKNDPPPSLSEVTLRQFLSDSRGFHLALAPAFFGFYAYFGALTAFHENVLLLADDDNNDNEDGGDTQMPQSVVLPVRRSNLNTSDDDNITTTTNKTQQQGRRHYRPQAKDILLKSVAGASAGAMSAVMLASGVNPRDAAEFASSMTLQKFADPPGLGGMLKGDLFERILLDFLKEGGGGGGVDDEKQQKEENLTFEDAHVPVAVTGFDLFRMGETIMTEGCMARATRASATFPGLFQPVGWWTNNSSSKRDTNQETELSPLGYDYLARLKQRYNIPDALLIDGGITDPDGLNGLSVLLPNITHKRIVNLSVGPMRRIPRGPSRMPIGLQASEVVSVTIENTPLCGPWAMENGPRAVRAAREAMKAVLDLPMYRGEEDGHYVVRIDATAFVPA